MAFIYEVNGVRVQFDHEPTDADIDEAARGLGAKPESRMPKPVEGSGGAAFGVYRPAGRRPESQQDREASKDMPVQTARGIVSNIPAIAGIPGSVVNAAANLPRTAQDLENRYQKAREAFTGQAPQEQPLPEYNQVTPYDMSYFAQLTPGPQPSSPAGALAFGAGQMVGAPIVPPAMKMMAPAAKYGYELGKDVLSAASHPIQTGKTAIEAFGRGYKNPAVVGGPDSALMPIRETYYPHEQVAEYLQGQRTPLQMNEVPTSTITQNNVFNKFATNVAPTNEMGQPLVAPRGRGIEGYMENLGASYKNQPLMGALDIATTLGGIGPVSAMAKAVPAIAARQLQKATQFEPNFNAADIHAAQGQAGLKANMPTMPALPAPGPQAPIQMPGPQRNVNIEGQSFNLPQQIDVSNSQAARPQPVAPVVPKGTPAQISQQMAAQKLTENVQPQPTVAQPVVPEGMPELPADRFTNQDRLTVKQMLEQMRKQKAEGTPVVEKEQTPAQMEKEQKKMAEAAKTDFNKSVIDDFASNGSSDKIDMMSQTVPIDVSKAVYNESNATRGMADWLLKHGVDSIPVLEGMTEAQIVSALFKSMTGKGGRKTVSPTKKDLGTEINLPKKEVFDPNNSQQSYDELMETTSMEKRYRGMSQVQLLKAEQDLNKVINNPNAYPSDLNLAKQGLEFIRKYKK